MHDKQLKQYLDGDILYGDDFSPEEIRQWFADEEEGYASLIDEKQEREEYAFHAIDSKYGFSYLDTKRFGHAMGLGSAYGEEFLPLANRIDSITIVEPSEKFKREEIGGIRTEYIKPNFDGSLPFSDGQFELILTFSVLHHIPNVSYVIQELARVTASGGYVLIREPITSMREPIHSMEDWNRHKRGLTKRERGIPIGVFRRIFAETNLEIVSERFWSFPVVERLAGLVNISPFNYKWPVFLDSLLCKLFVRNVKYHTSRKIEKFRPAAVFYVLRKQ
jgi:SAM-dependent methyltransferase